MRRPGSENLPGLFSLFNRALPIGSMMVAGSKHEAN